MVARVMTQKIHQTLVYVVFVSVLAFVGALLKCDRFWENRA